MSVDGWFPVILTLASYCFRPGFLWVSHWHLMVLALASYTMVLALASYALRDCFLYVIVMCWFLVVLAWMACLYCLHASCVDVASVDCMALIVS